MTACPARPNRNLERISANRRPIGIKGSHFAGGTVMHTISSRLRQASARLRTAAPYLLLLLMPGGTTLTLALLLYRRKGHVIAPHVQRVIALLSAAFARSTSFMALAWPGAWRTGRALAPLRIVSREGRS
jgi:hypothetical protein